MFLSVAVAVPETSEESHAAADIYNTGECRSQTAVAVSADLNSWEWLGIVFPTPDTGWDGYCRRITAVMPCADGYVAFYDGSASYRENYEERAGLAESGDLRNWRSLTPEGPLFDDLPGSGSVRYIDAVAIRDDVYLYYELSRPDRKRMILKPVEPGAHIRLTTDETAQRKTGAKIYGVACEPERIRTGPKRPLGNESFSNDKASL